MMNATAAKTEFDPPIRAYSTKAFSKAFSISRSKLFVMLRDGDIQSVLVGGKRLIPADEGERLITPKSASDQPEGAH